MDGARRGAVSVPHRAGGSASAHLLGRKLYETMVYWETADEDPSISDDEAEFARIWQQLPKVVFSSTLTEVEGNARPATGGVEEEVAGLKSQFDGEIAVGGPGRWRMCRARPDRRTAALRRARDLRWTRRSASPRRSTSSSPRPGPSATWWLNNHRREAPSAR